MCSRTSRTSSITSPPKQRNFIDGSNSGVGNVTSSHASFDSLHSPPLTLGQVGCPTPLLMTSGGHHWRNVQICALDTLPPRPPLTFSGGHRNTYGWQVAGTHPTGMLSCCVLKFRRWPFVYCLLFIHLKMVEKILTDIHCKMYFLVLPQYDKMMVLTWLSAAPPRQVAVRAVTGPPSFPRGRQRDGLYLRDVRVLGRDLLLQLHQSNVVLQLTCGVIIIVHV